MQASKQETQLIMMITATVFNTAQHITVFYRTNVYRLFSRLNLTHTHAYVSKKQEQTEKNVNKSEYNRRNTHTKNQNPKKLHDRCDNCSHRHPVSS